MWYKKAEKLNEDCKKHYLEKGIIDIGEINNMIRESIMEEGWGRNGFCDHIAKYKHLHAFVMNNISLKATFGENKPQPVAPPKRLKEHNSEDFFSGLQSLNEERKKTKKNSYRDEEGPIAPTINAAKYGYEYRESRIEDIDKTVKMSVMQAHQVLKELEKVPEHKRGLVAASATGTHIGTLRKYSAMTPVMVKVDILQSHQEAEVMKNPFDSAEESEVKGDIFWKSYDGKFSVNYKEKEGYSITYTDVSEDINVSEDKKEELI